MINRQTYLLLISVIISVNIIGWSWQNKKFEQIGKRGHFEESSSGECDNLIFSNDTCAFVVENCSDHSGIVNYLQFYFCQESSVLRLFAFGAILSWLLFLFGFVGIAASDFLCPNLNTIASSLNLSESLAGVTFLAFGNGSPDVFSTFSAMKAQSGTLALGELIGAASFITSVIAGSMAVIQPFRANRVPFLRDLSFFAGAILFTMWIIWDTKIYLWEGIFLIVYYIAYVTIVIVGNWWWQRRKAYQQLVQTARDEYSDAAAQGEETSRLLLSNTEDDQDTERYLNDNGDEDLDLESSPVIPTRKHGRRGQLPPPLDISRLESPNPLHPVTPRPGFRPSLFSAIEFHDVVQSLRRIQLPDYAQAQHKRTRSHSIRRSKSTPPLPERELLSLGHSMPMHSQSQPAISLHPSNISPHAPLHIIVPSDDSQQSDYRRSPTSATMIIGSVQAGDSSQSQAISSMFPPTLISPAVSDNIENSPMGTYQTQSQGILNKIDEPLNTLLPSLRGWEKKSIFAKCSSVIAAPMILLLTVTLPVVDEENMQELEYQEEFSVPEPANNEFAKQRRPPRWLPATQMFCAPLYFAIIFFAGGTLSSVFILYGAILGAVASSVYLLSRLESHPRYYRLLCFIGFVIAMVHIYIIANEVVGVFQALGLILGLSDAILGLTIFAAGNSLGDLVANITIARMGYPLMGFSACFGGPMLNILLGVGISSTYMTSITNEPYSIIVAPTILVSSAGLLLILLSSLVMVPFNDYWISKRFGIGWIAIYLICTSVNVLLEITKSQ